MSKTLQVGQTLYWYGSFSGRGNDYSIREQIIEKVGKKYITTPNFTIEMSTMRNKSNYRSFQFYTDKQVIVDELKFAALYKEIKDAFGSYDGSKYTLSQLQRISEIINEKQ